MLEDSKAFSGFAVDDVDAAKEFYDETLEVRTKVLDEAAFFAAGREGISLDPSGPSVAWFKDPAGNILAVTELDAAA